ncbi:MAG: CoA-binding protein [Actinobacteria bacterium]|nr:CoA-binding protein [Actinomycetota bacterium]MDI6830461.1 CoA-binding protein [Actinomycetota bacterium]
MTPESMRAVEALFNPRRMAVVGASANLGKWGNIIPTNILRDGYKGELYLVNPRGGELKGIPVHRSLAAIGKEIDLAMITIPAEKVEGVMEDCARAGVKVAIVISGGFSESSPEGRAMEESLVRKARSLGIRLVGPNTMGITSAPWSLTALMPPVQPRAGHVAFAAQSGNLGTQMLGWGSYRGIGFSRFVCIGNECDLDFADYLEYFARDDETRVILLYVEGFKRPRRILELAEEITPHKPVVIYKAGGTGAGSRAAASHSASMAGSREIYQGMIRQAGMIRAETTEEMLDFSDALVKLPAARGRRTAILSWGGGWAVVAADLCERAGLDVAPLPPEIREELAGILPSYWSKGNPVDMVGILDLDKHVRCLEILATCPHYDLVVSLGTINAAGAFGLAGREEQGEDMGDLERARRYYVQERSAAFARRVAELMEEQGKPIVTVGMPQRDSDSDLLSGYPWDRITIYTNPERAARVASMLAERGDRLRSLPARGA